MIVIKVIPILAAFFPTILSEAKKLIGNANIAPIKVPIKAIAKVCKAI